MNIQTQEAMFEYQLKNAITKMIANSPEFEGMNTESALHHLELSGETLEDFIERNPREFGQAMAAVVFDFMGGDDLIDLMESE